jgi:hypothetical protein
MDISSLRLHNLHTLLASLVGLLGVGGGIYCLTDPIAFSDTLGIPVTSTSSPALPFVSFVGARNLSSGLAMITLLYTGQRKAAGVLLMSGVVAAMADASICATYKAKEGKAAVHAVMGVFMGALGGSFYWG